MESGNIPVVVNKPRIEIEEKDEGQLHHIDEYVSEVNHEDVADQVIELGVADENGSIDLNMQSELENEESVHDQLNPAHITPMTPPISAPLSPIEQHHRAFDGQPLPHNHQHTRFISPQVSQVPQVPHSQALQNYQDIQKGMENQLDADAINQYMQNMQNIQNIQMGMNMNMGLGPNVGMGMHMNQMEQMGQIISQMGYPEYEAVSGVFEVPEGVTEDQFVKFVLPSGQ
ncbi:hypothetical protein BKA69DRAFT_1040897 [Paraphysoderma sedebokerense]|nr:hypothetical protein BKA69DRAFT_1040897 [Paraphysoderma sedebokerense]